MNKNVSGICIAAMAIAIIHDVIGPSIQLGLQRSIINQVKELKARRPSIEIVPEPSFRAKPELRKEKL